MNSPNFLEDAASTSAQVLTLQQAEWHGDALTPTAIAALEAGQVLFFPRLAFTLHADEQRLLTPAVRDPKARNISLGSDGQLKGGLGDAATLAALTTMVARFQTQAGSLIEQLLPHYVPALRAAPTSYRPMQVESRAQSWRADDRRLHVDAFVSRPNYGERILRVFTNINPVGVATCVAHRRAVRNGCRPIFAARKTLFGLAGTRLAQSAHHQNLAQRI